ncbi:hypothetical protein KFE25_009360 [Diacronema lutheri]|uniref:Uncharacterized protein n=1 Tax=Diacronema lutheri TaxID=2081491 RepID=A0A8J5XUP2_DIALT|nr:hypothetical protein KFE25_009360 [Diacronema lutheri]
MLRAAWLVALAAASSAAAPAERDGGAAPRRASLPRNVRPSLGAALALRGGARGHDMLQQQAKVALQQAKVARSALPRDVSAALSTGALSLDELRNYLAIRNSPFLRALAAISPFVRDRLIANPRLASVIAIETLLGIATLLAAEVGARGDRLLAEVDFVVCDLALVVATNIALVMALSPAARICAPPSRGRSAVASLPATFLQPGAFSAAQRLACFVINAARFGAIGIASSALGASATKALVMAREQITGRAPDVQLAPVLSTALAYGAFVAASSSTRYQLVNAIEASLLPRLPHGTGALSAALRLGNNYVGSLMWIWWARAFGVQ